MSKIVSVGLACLFSFGIFVLMTLLIDSDAKAIDTAPNEPIVFEVIPKDLDPEVINPRSKKDIPEPPKLIKIPGISTTIPVVKGPKLPPVATLRPTIDIGVGEPVLVGEPGELFVSGELAPKIRIEPSYPPEAAINGVQGAVTLRFDVNELGETTNIQVIASNPKGLFEDASRKAVRKWKYTPQQEEGIAVASLNQVVTLEFKLEQN